jgi:RES domain-containing protein
MDSPFSGELTTFRIGHRQYPIFDGSGAFKYGSRWCTPGRYIIYTASTYSLTVLENVVHWRIAFLPPDQQYIRITIPEVVSRQVLDPDHLPAWDQYPYGPSQQYGDNWYDGTQSAALIVPSVLSPFEPNVLLNQRHSEFQLITATDPQPAILDERLFESRSGWRMEGNSAAPERE